MTEEFKMPEFEYNSKNFHRFEALSSLERRRLVKLVNFMLKGYKLSAGILKGFPDEAISILIDIQRDDELKEAQEA